MFLNEAALETLCAGDEAFLTDRGWTRSRDGWLDPQSGAAGQKPYTEETQIGVSVESDRHNREGSPVMRRQLVLPAETPPLPMAAAIELQKQRDDPELSRHYYVERSIGDRRTVVQRVEVTERQKGQE